MLKIKKTLFLIFILTFFGCFYVKAKECNYPELDLKIVDGKVDKTDWSLLENAIYLKSPLKIENRDDVSNSVQEILNNGQCAKNVFACVYIEAGVEDAGLIKNISDVLSGNSSLLDIKDSISHLHFEQTNLLYNEEEFKKSNYYRVYSRGGNMISTTSMDAIEGAFNTCSGGRDDVLSQFAGGFCSIVWGSIFETPFSAGNTVVNLTRENKVYYSQIECKKSVSDDPDAVDANCSQLKYLKDDYQKVIDEYKAADCKDNTECKTKKIDLMNDYDSRIKGICSSIMKTFNYDDLQSSCLDECIKMNKTINDMKKGTDLYFDLSKNGTCNMSDRVIKWLANIFKWVKYIAPVLVIILSILDFIKAIASQNDDEMKKAQGRFVKRLISAALLFLVPFIIEFALDAFNLVPDNTYCDLI